jgi:hypothetical protein
MKIKNYGASPYGFYVNGDVKMLRPDETFECDSVPDCIAELMRRDDYPLSIESEPEAEIEPEQQAEQLEPEQPREVAPEGESEPEGAKIPRQKRKR